MFTAILRITKYETTRINGLIGYRCVVSQGGWGGGGRGVNTAPDALLDIYARGFWSRQGSTFFDLRVCHPNAESYKDPNPQQIYRQHENDKS